MAGDAESAEGVFPHPASVGPRGLSTEPGATHSASGRFCERGVRPEGVSLDDAAQLLRIDRLLVDDVVEARELAALDDVILVEVERGHQHDGQARMARAD